MSHDNPEIEVIDGSARATTALAIRRRQHLTTETAGVSDLALRLAVRYTEHRTCFIRDCHYDVCWSCEDIVSSAREIDSEMDRAGVPRETRKLPYPTREECE